MNLSVDEECKKLYGKLYEIYLDIKTSLVPACINCDNEWQMNIIQDCDIEKILEETKKEFEQTHSKIERKTKKCIFFGETSSGKSSLINATLGRDVLPKGFGSISTCFVEIKSIPSNRTDNRSYLVINREEKEIVLLEDSNYFQSENLIPTGSHLDLFCDSANCPILKNDVVFIDTPGIDKDILTDGRVEEYCNDADLIIVVVNSTTWSNNSSKGFIDRLKKCFTKLNLAIVFNFWDHPDKNPKSYRIKSQFTEEARDILRGRLGYPIEGLTERIHFLSAYERILFNFDDRKLQYRGRWELRNEAFIRFSGYLQRLMKESSFERKYNYLCQWKETLISVLNKYRSVVSEMSSKIDEKSKQIKDNFNDISELEVELKTSTASIYLLVYNTFIEEARKIKRNATESRDSKEDKLVSAELESLLDEIIKKSKEDLKAKMKDCIRRTNNKYLPGNIFITENIYFPLYFDQISIKYEEGYVEILNKIRKKRKTLDGLTIGLSTLTVGANMAPGNNIKKHFHSIRKKDSDLIRLAWNNLGEEICNSYRKFLNEIDLNLQNKVLSLNLELIEFEYKLYNLDNELILFHNTFLPS